MNMLLDCGDLVNPTKAERKYLDALVQARRDLETLCRYIRGAGPNDVRCIQSWEGCETERCLSCETWRVLDRLGGGE